MLDSDTPDTPHTPDRRDRLEPTGGPEPNGPEPDGLEPDGMVWRVGPGEAAGLAAAFREAVRQAAELTAAFDRAGLRGELLALTAGLDAAGAPLVTGVVTWAGVRWLAVLLAAGEPPPGLALRPGRPPWAA